MVSLQILRHQQSFTLLFALVIVSVVLTASLAAFTVMLKELKLTRFGPERAIANYAANSGAECAMYWSLNGVDFIAGSGYHAGTTCGGTLINSNSFTVSFGADGGCARVLVSKNGEDTVIQSRGYNTCTNSKVRVERGVQYTFRPIEEP